MPPPLTFNFFFFQFSSQAYLFLVSFMHSYVSLPTFLVSFLHLSKTIKIFKFSTSPSLFFSPTLQSLFPQPNRSIRQTEDGHGLSTKTNENNHFRLPRNNRLFSQRNRLISRYFVAIFFLRKQQARSTRYFDHNSSSFQKK